MKIELSNGYVVLKEVITRKISREYTAKLFEGATINNEGKSLLSPMNYENASEYLVMSLLEKIAVLKEGTEQAVLVDREWLDNLPVEDWKKIERAVLDINKSKEEQVKK